MAKDNLWGGGGLLVLKSLLVGNGKFLAAFFPAGGQYSATIGRSHTLTEAVLVLPFSAGWLECSLHFKSGLRIRGAKMCSIFRFASEGVTVEEGQGLREGFKKRFWGGFVKPPGPLSLQSVFTEKGSKP